VLQVECEAEHVLRAAKRREPRRVGALGTSGRGRDPKAAKRLLERLLVGALVRREPPRQLKGGAAQEALPDRIGEDGGALEVEEGVQLGRICLGLLRAEGGRDFLAARAAAAGDDQGRGAASCARRRQLERVASCKLDHPILLLTPRL